MYYVPAFTEMGAILLESCIIRQSLDEWINISTAAPQTLALDALSNPKY